MPAVFVRVCPSLDLHVASLCLLCKLSMRMLSSLVFWLKLSIGYLKDDELEVSSIVRSQCGSFLFAS